MDSPHHQEPQTPTTGRDYGFSYGTMLEDTFLNTPVGLPQATSTVDKKLYHGRLQLSKHSAPTLDTAKQLNESPEREIGNGTGRPGPHNKSRVENVTSKLRQLQLYNQEQNGTFCTSHDRATSDSASMASSLGILPVDSLEEFPDETKRIARMLEISRSSCDSTSPERKADAADDYYVSQLMSPTRRKTNAEVSYLVSDLRVRKQRALALRAINKHNNQEGIFPSLPHQPQHILSKDATLAQDISAGLSSSGDFSIVASEMNTNPFSVNSVTKYGNNFSSEEFIAADCSQAAAILQADEQECAERNQEVAPPLTLKTPIQDISHMVSENSPVDVTVGSTFLGPDHHGEQARLAIDEFFLMRTDKIGALGETDFNQRPSFGRVIISPEKRRNVRANVGNCGNLSSNSGDGKRISKDIAASENQLENNENLTPVGVKNCVAVNNLNNKTADNNSIKEVHILKDNSNILQQPKPKASNVEVAPQFARCATDHQDAELLEENQNEKSSFRDASYDGDCSSSINLSGTLLTVNDVNRSTVSDSEMSDGWLLIDENNPTKCNNSGTRGDVTQTQDYDNMIELVTETGDPTTLNFGLLPEQCCRQLIVTLLNRSLVDVTLRISVVDHSTSDRVFSVTDGASVNESQRGNGLPLVCHLKSQQKLYLLVSCLTPSLQLLQSPDSHKIVNLSGVLTVDLDLPHPPARLRTLDLVSSVGFTLLSFSKDSTSLLTLKCAEGRTVTHGFPMRNDGSVPLDLTVEVEQVAAAAGDPSDLRVDPPAQIRLLPGEETAAVLRYAPSSVQPRFTNYRLSVTVEPNGQTFETEVLCVAMVGRQTRSTSRCSNGSSARGSTGDVTKSSSEDSGETTLQIKSTQKELAWPSLPVGKSHVKSFVVKNFANHTSKVRVTVTDPTKSYKLRNDQGEEVDQRKLMLSANEACKLSVLLKPTKVGAVVGTVEFSSVPPVAGPQQLMKLYAYCGQGQLGVQGIPKDGAGKMWLSLGTLTATRCALQARFTLHNTGNLSIFAKIKLLEKGFRVLCDRGLTVQPSEMIIAAGQSVPVRVFYQPQPGEGSSVGRDIIELAMLQILTGDNVTRMRLRRLVKKYKFTDEKLASTCGFNLGELCSKFPGEQSMPDVELLRDPESAVGMLCHSLTVQEISLIMERPLDATSGFGTHSMYALDESTRLFHTLCNDSDVTTVTSLEPSPPEAVSWSVWPKELFLTPPAITSKDIWVRNSSSRDQTFEVEVCDDSLLVRPNQGTIAANDCIKLTVYCTSLRGRSSQSAAMVKILLENDMQVLVVHLKHGRVSDITGVISGGQTAGHRVAPLEASTPLRRVNASTHSRRATGSASLLKNKLNANLDETILSGSGLSSIIGSHASPPKTSGRQSAGRASRKNRKVHPSDDRDAGVTLVSPDVVTNSGVASRDTGTEVTKDAQDCGANNEPMPAVEEAVCKASTPDPSEMKVANGSANLDVVSEPASTSTSRRSIAINLNRDVSGSTGAAVARSISCGTAADRGEKGAVDEEPTRDLSLALGPCLSPGLSLGIFSDNYFISFPAMTVGRVSSFKITLKNPTSQNYKLKVCNLKPPFSASAESFEMKAKWYLSFKAYFRPTTSGPHQQYVLVESMGSGAPLRFLFSGKGLAKQCG